MKNTAIVLLLSVVLFSCSKKSVPEKPVVATRSARVVIDGYGKVRTPLDQLPKDENIKASYGSLARAFTPNQLTNLKFRYKTVPPKVLYVPEAYAQTSAKGKYAIYKKQFWYWKKADGLFHLDEVYYQ